MMGRWKHASTTNGPGAATPSWRSRRDHKVKTLLVYPGKRLSYQRHRHRGEHWFVVRGTGTVTLDGVDHAVRPGTAVDVPVGTAHRIENTGEVDLVIIEIQRGESFDEDDIERLEDDFGRAVHRP